MFSSANRAPLWRRALVGAAGTALVVTPLGLVQTAQADTASDEVTWSRTTLDTGVVRGYQMGVDPVNRKVYFTDAQQRVDSREKVATFDSAGNPNGYFWQKSHTEASARVLEFDMAKKSLSREFSYLDLTRLGANAKKEGEAHSWDGFTNDEASQSQNSMRTHFSPNGIAIDPNTTYDGVVDPTIITTHVRQRSSHPDGGGGGIVIYRASQGAPTDADRLWEFEDGSAISSGSRRVAINTTTHKAFITNMGDRGRSGDPAKGGYVTVIDLVTKKVDARIAIPAPQDTRAAHGGVIGVTVDESTNTVYAGVISGGDLTTDQSKIFAIDASNLDTSDPKSKVLNASKVSELSALVPTNARPKYVEADKRLYVSSYDSGTISVIDADKTSATYGQLLDQVVDGPTNSVEVDAERNLLYSAGLGDKELKVYDTETLDEVVTIPTYARANDIAVDPATGEVWVGYFSFAGMPSDKAEVFDITLPEEAAAPAAAEVDLSVAGATFGKAGKATVVVTDAEGAAAKGAVTVTAGGKAVKATLKRGEATVALPASLKAGKHAVTVAYAGTDTVGAARATGTLTVAKASVKLAAKVAKKATVKKAGKVKVSVKSTVAGTPATGKVTLTLKKGKATKKVTGTLKNNTVTVKLPKLKKGKWKATAKYAGASSYASASTKVTVVVK